MAHPNKDEGVKGHNAKLRRLTQDYGAANPSMNKLAKVDRIGKGGPQESVGFGVDAGAQVLCRQPHCYLQVWRARA